LEHSENKGRGYWARPSDLLLASLDANNNKRSEHSRQTCWN